MIIKCLERLAFLDRSFTRIETMVRTLRDQRDVDGDLLRQIASGNRKNTMDLYDRYCSAAYGLAFDLVRCPQLAEQIVLRTFLVVSRHAKSFDVQSCSAATWIATSIESFARIELQLDS